MSDLALLKLTSIGFQVSNCFFLSQTDLLTFKEGPVFEKVLNLYGIPRFSFAAEHLDILQTQLLHVKQNTAIQQAAGIDKMLNQIDRERTALSCPFSKRNPLRLKKNQLLHDIVSDRCSEADPVNVVEDDFLLSNDDDSGGFFDVD
jgi:hypothetical protein